ncbi:MAG: 3-deoxy-manno-octulosonate cytidylyltransferase [Halieaceae bacterium]|nr:3-deoxy-manno-octulosonate cytidylyltransferase [Halieaceae bacterium]MBT5208914.1 3-deoxy-manno-octulosonate cytidylyltransferase [Halieaceae bacterium]MBT6332816.1 3-deoxy-manno-octulosonate cytidylyltransferase [Halieaceae bacterium]MBT7340872.1 3-deoxy-manno-octulosonate cytidylyltransferase [Halieaceae bacterium]
MFNIVIPARFASTRLPGKPLLDIGGRPMIWWVWRQACAAGAESVVIATDDTRIAEVMTAQGADVAMTSTDHASGTDRLAEVVRQRGWTEDSIVVNVQGDEPLMPIANIKQVARELIEHPEASIATLSELLASAEQLDDPSVVKVVASMSGNALYFSRAAIPFQRDQTEKSSSLLLAAARRHIGLYAYRAAFLQAFAAWPPSVMETLESLEQLRALDQGHIIRICEASEPVPAGVDTPEDLERARGLLVG